MPDHHYIPALSLKWLTPLYDALVEGPMAMLRMRRDLLAGAGDLNGRRVLDVGSGTGSLALLVKVTFPGAEVVGLDGDPQILEIARGKAREAGLDIRFDHGMSFDLPYPEGSFDAVFTSLMLHHLDREAKEKTAAEMFRVLKPGGHLYGIDFAEPKGRLGRSLRPLTRRFERVADNLDGFLPILFAAAGFREYREPRRYLLGSVAQFIASRP